MVSEQQRFSFNLLPEEFRELVESNESDHMRRVDWQPKGFSRQTTFGLKIEEDGVSLWIMNAFFGISNGASKLYYPVILLVGNDDRQLVYASVKSYTGGQFEGNYVPACFSEFAQLAPFLEEYSELIEFEAGTFIEMSKLQGRQVIMDKSSAKWTNPQAGSPKFQLKTARRRNRNKRTKGFKK